LLELSRQKYDKKLRELDQAEIKIDALEKELATARLQKDELMV